MWSGIASAITYGQPDGDRHPNVGALVGAFDGQTYFYCSGTRISPTVFLTAAHCDIGTEQVYVAFDSTYTSKSKLYSGTFYANPLYPGLEKGSYDIAVVVFDKSIRGFKPAQLPTPSDSLTAWPRTSSSPPSATAARRPSTRTRRAGHRLPRHPRVRGLHFERGRPQLPAPLAEPGDRQRRHLLRRLRGPNFLGAGSTETDIIADITITGDALCKYMNVIYRLDTGSAHAFLGRFVTLP